MKITQEVKEFFKQVPVMAISTVDKNGVPNVAAIASKKVIDDNTILTIDTFHNKTIENIKQNKNVALAMWKDSEGYQIKGKATLYTEGEIFEKGKKWILELKPQKIVKGVMVIEVTDVFYLTPNYNLAGKKL